MEYTEAETTTGKTNYHSSSIAKVAPSQSANNANNCGKVVECTEAEATTRSTSYHSSSIAKVAPSWSANNASNCGKVVKCTEAETTTRSTSYHSSSIAKVAPSRSANNANNDSSVQEPMINKVERTDQVLLTQSGKMAKAGQANVNDWSTTSSRVQKMNLLVLCKRVG